MIRRMCRVRDLLAQVDTGVEPAEIYEVNLIGEWIPLDESRLPDGRPVARGDYARRSNDQAIRWKHRSSALPDQARGRGSVRGWGGTYDVDYAVPAAYAHHNLLPEVREASLALFEVQEIVWHQSIDGGPSNHLRSSQVQCVNALGQMMTDPDRITRAFGGVLDIASVRDLGVIDPAEKARFLTFEFVGLHDYFGEGRAGVLTRGSQSTSVDAAFAYVDGDGRDALALVEWKFTETYPHPDGAADRKVATRLKRYAEALQRPDGPIAVEGIDIPELFHEPIYQLVRQQLLASELERDERVKAGRVSVVHVLSPDNTAYQGSYISPGLRDRGDSVDEVWQSLLRRSEAFAKLDPAVFLDPAVTSEEYVLRYGGTDA